MENSIKSIAINYGLYLGGILSLITVAIYAIDLQLMVNMWIGIGLFLIIIALGMVSIAKSKNILEGFISFKQAFTSYFITVLIGLVIIILLNYILFNLIDPEAAELIKEKTIETTVAFLEGFNTPPDAIAEAVEKMENDNQYSLGNLIQGLAIQLVLYSVIGLIVAAIMKKNKPDA